MPKDEALLEEIRERFDEDVREWGDIRDAGREDTLMLADGPWSAEERKERKAASRVCLSFDELSQYVNQTMGDARQNKRAIKVTPQGDGADDSTALKRAGMIRQIEYDSNAQTAYSTAFENMLRRSYGFFKLGSRYQDPAGGFDQVLYIGSVPNPDTILVDPFAKEPDWSDMGHAFELESFSEKEFAKRWPDAEKTSFDSDDRRTAPSWLNDRIQVGSYWRLEKKKRKQLQIDLGQGQGPVDIYLDEIPGAKIDGNQLVMKGPSGDKTAIPLLNVRKCEVPSVCQYITNGLEILETNPQKWIEIPIIPLFGPEEYVDDGGGSKRRLLSIVRKARDAYMSYCYVRTNEVEAIGMIPKIIYKGYEGQFATKTPWDEINKVALPYGEVKAKTTATGDALLPLPERESYDPPIQGLEMAAAAFKQAIQSAMCGGGMLNGKNSQNMDAKSGKAIEALDRQESQGTYIYVSIFERGISRAGRMLEQGLTWCYDSPRDAGFRAPDDKYTTEKINQVDPVSGQPVGFHTTIGDHATTISVGPSDDSTREAANDFAETLLNIKGVPPKILALCVKLKNLGPIGDEIAEAFDPQPGPGDAAAAQQQVQGLTQKLQTTEAFAQSLHEQIQTKQAELDVRVQIAQMQEETKRVIGLATINSQEAQTKLEEELGIVHKKVDQIHEANMEQLKHGHARELQAGQQAADANAQASDQGAKAGSQASKQRADAASQASSQAAEAQAQGADQAHQARQQQSAQDATAEQATQAQEAAADATGTP